MITKEQSKELMYLINECLKDQEELCSEAMNGRTSYEYQFALEEAFDSRKQIVKYLEGITE